MNKSDLKQATRLLEPLTDRIETMAYEVNGEDRGQVLTAHWVGGGQGLFYTLDEVRRHIAPDDIGGLQRLIDFRGLDCLHVDTAAYGWPHGPLRLVWDDGSEKTFTDLGEAAEYVCLIVD